MKDNINFQEIFQIIKKKSKLISTFILGALLISGLLTFFVMTPKYESSTQILVNQEQNNSQDLNSQDLQSSRELINTYSVIITSPAILEPVINNTNYNGNIDELRSQISVSSEEESQIATLTVESNSSEKAVELANNIASTFEEEIPNIMNVDNVSILSVADMNDANDPVSPQPVLNLAIAFFTGLMAGVGVAFLMEFLDKSIKDEQDLEKTLDLPLLGIVPTIKEGEFKGISPTPNGSNLRKKNREKERSTF